MVVDWCTNELNVEGKSLEERNCIFSLYFLEDNCEFLIRDLVNEVSLELNNDVITSEDRAESVTLVAEEAEAITLEDNGVVETGLNRCLRGHDSEVLHILETLVLDLNLEGEGLGLRVDFGGAYLLEFDLGLQLLNSLLNERV